MFTASTGKQPLPIREMNKILDYLYFICCGLLLALSIISVIPGGKEMIKRIEELIVISE